MKTIFTFLVLSFFWFGALATGDKPLISDEALNESKSYSLAPDIGFMLGSSFMQFQGAGSVFNQSIAPVLKWNPSKNFNLKAGAVVSNFNFSSVSDFSALSFNTDITGNTMPQSNITSSMFFVAGSYDLSSRLTISGAGYYDQNKTSLVLRNQNSMFGNNEIKGMMLGLDFKISENFRFGTEINISTGYNPMNPFNQGYSNQSLFRRYNSW